MEFDSRPTKDLLKAWIKERDAKGGSIIQEWTEYVEQSGLSFTDLSQICTTNKPYHMALYVRFLFIEKGLRAEQVGRAIAKVKGLFWNEVWPDANLWDHPLVERAVGLSGRTNQEQRDDIARKASNEKFNMVMDMFVEVRSRLDPHKIRWSDVTCRDDLDEALQYLLLALMLDVGMRVGNASPTTIRGNEKATRDAWKAEEKERRKEKARRMALNPGLTEDEEEEQSDPVLTHIMRMKDWRFCVENHQAADGWEMRTGEEFLDDLENGLTNDMVIYAQVWFPTTKTAKKTKATTMPIWATLGRRSEPEIEILLLMVNFLRWRGKVDGNSPLLARPGRSLKGRSAHSHRSNKTKTTSIDSVIALCKVIAVEQGVPEPHMSAICIRKGHVTLMRILAGRDHQEEERGLEAARARGGKWTAHSEMPRKHYLAELDDKGVFARLTSWEQSRTVDQGFEGWRRRLVSVSQL